MSKVTAQLVINCKGYALELFRVYGDLVRCVENSIVHYQIKHDLNEEETNELRQRVLDKIDPTLEES
ncbi:MAG: hypothetical protein ACMXYK_04760 [Candidatus Woesearchaeota archaeon]